MNKPLPYAKKLKLVAVGNSTGVVLPKEVLRRLGLTKGDSVEMVETEEGLALRSGDAEFDAQIAVARQVMATRRRALRELAK